MKLCKVKNALASAYLVFSLVTVGFFGIIVLEIGIEKSIVQASSTWTQTSDLDFENGTFDNITIIGNGNPARLQIDISDLPYWVQKKPLNSPCTRDWYAMTTIYGDDKVVLFGGGREDGIYFNDTWVYDLSDENWINKTPVNHPSARKIHAMASIYGTDKVVLFGGSDGTINSFNDTWIYDLSENNWTKKNFAIHPGTRFLHSMATIYGTDKVLLYGGSYWTGNWKVWNDTWVYDLSDDMWTKKNTTTIPNTTTNNGLAFIWGTDKVIIYSDNSLGNNETSEYDLSDNSWSEKKPICHLGSRSGYSITSIYDDDKVVLFGGGNPSIQKDTWVYDLSANNWIEIKTSIAPQARVRHAMAFINGTNKVVLFGGITYNPNPTWINDTWIYNQVSYIRNGTYVSAPYNIGNRATFNDISWDALTSINTSIRFQLRSDDNRSNLINNSFIGPDGNSSTYYVLSPSNIWSGHSGDRWIQYKVYFNTSNKNESPMLNDVTITYNCWPNTTLISPVNGTISSNNKPNFTWNFTDSDSEQQKAFQILIDNDIEFQSVEYNSEQQVLITHQWQFPIGTDYTEIADGTWFWKVRTQDSDGAWGEFSQPFKIIIDTSNPSSTISTPKNNRFYNSLNVISGTANDHQNGTGLDRVEITIKRLNNNDYWDGSKWEPEKTWLLTSGTNNWYYSSNFITWDLGVQYKVQSRSMDFANNIETPTIGNIFIIDNENVTFSNFIPQTNTIYTNTNIEVGITISDNISGVNGSSIKYSVSTDDGTTWNPWQSILLYENNMSIDVKLNLTFNDSVSNRIRWQASDIAGNGPVISSAYPVKINTWLIPPNVILQTPMNGSVIKSNSIELTWVLERWTFSSVTYDIYLYNEKTFDKISKTVVNSTNTIIHDLTYGQTYYWTVIPRIGNNYGKCNSGIWEFRIELPDPCVKLISPENGSIIESVFTTLDWSLEYIGTEIVTFDIYFGTENNLTLDYENYLNMNYTITEILEFGQTYYWKIMPKIGEKKGVESETWSFKIKEKKYIPNFALKLSLEPNKIEMTKNEVKYVKAIVFNLGEITDLISLNVTIPAGIEINVIVKEPKIVEISPGGSAEFNMEIMTKSSAQNGEISISVIAESNKANDYGLKVEEKAILLIKIQERDKPDGPSDKWFNYISWDLLIIIIILILVIIISLILIIFRNRLRKQKKYEVETSSETSALQTPVTSIDRPEPEADEYEPDIETIESFKNQMDAWKSEGYNVSRLENLYSTDERMFVKVFPVFSSNISRLKDISEKLVTMNIEGYDEKMNSIKNKLFEPDLALSTLKEFDNLKTLMDPISANSDSTNLLKISTSEATFQSREVLPDQQQNIDENNKEIQIENLGKPQ